MGINLPGAQIGTVARLVSSGSGKKVTADAYGLAMRFRVRVEELGDLGNWSGCSGLSVDFKPDELIQQGDYTGPVYLPGEISYHEVTLTRAMQKENSGQVRKMLQRVADQWIGWDGGDLKFTGTTVTITLMDSQGSHTIDSWVLADALPKSWTGPTLSGKSNEVATEQIVFVHRGFLSSAGR